MFRMHRIPGGARGALLLALVAMAGCSDDPTGTPSEIPVSQVLVAPAQGGPVGTLAVGASVQLGAVALGPSGEVLQGRSTGWSTDYPDRATVTPSGLVTAVSPGPVRISAAIGGRSGEVELTVVEPAPPVTRVEVSPTAVVLQVGQERAFTARAFDALDREIHGLPVTWTVAAGGVAVHLGQGRVRALAPGYSQVNATIAGTTAASAITVEAPEPVVRLDVAPSRTAVWAGTSTVLEGKAFGAGDVVLEGARVEWFSDDPTVAAVDSTGTVRGFRAGEVRIGARSGGRTAWATVKVRNFPSGEIQRYRLEGIEGMEGVVAAGSAVVVSGILELRSTDSRFEQVVTVDRYPPEVWLPPTREVVRLTGRYWYNWLSGQVMLEPDATPGEFILTRFTHAAGELVIPQSIDGGPPADWLWVIQ